MSDPSASDAAKALGSLSTERANAASAALDRMGADAAFELFQDEDASILAALARAKPKILAAIELVTSALRSGGRLVYVGAGTSGRLGVLDAVECPPTFGVDPGLVRGVLAGGEAALLRSIEGSEDDEAAGAEAISTAAVGAGDVVFGIAASGRTPFVHAALRRARELGAHTVFLACVGAEEAADEADVSIRVVTGPEILAGSTRLKAGTATKLVLNRVTTLAMVGLGKTYGNRMVDLASGANAKLRARARRLVAELAEVDAERAAALLESARGRVKTAVVMGRLGIAAEDAERRLEAAHGFLAAALDPA